MVHSVDDIREHDLVWLVLVEAPFDVQHVFDDVWCLQSISDQEQDCCHAANLVHQERLTSDSHLTHVKWGGGTV